MVFYSAYSFYFSGCNPGLNHFEDEQSCLEECVHPKGPKVCFLSKNKGSCQGSYHEWFFDMEKKTCSPFVHSGCLGKDFSIPGWRTPLYTAMHLLNKLNINKGT